MSRTMKLPKAFVLGHLCHQPEWGKKHAELAKRLPNEIEMTEDFARAHATEFMWVEAIRLLLEGEQLRRAFAREAEAAQTLHQALRGRERSWEAAERLSNVVAYETAGDSAFDTYDQAVALAFVEGLRAQGGARINRMQS